MIFNPAKVYTQLNAEDLKIGSQIVVANNLYDLRSFIESYSSFDEAMTLSRIMPETWERRFALNPQIDAKNTFALAYLISEPNT